MTAASDGEGWRLSGERLFVPYGAQADALLVPARTDAGAAFFLVEGGAEGLAHEDLVTTSGQPESKLRLDGVRAEPPLPGVFASVTISPPCAPWPRFRQT